MPTNTLTILGRVAVSDRTMGAEGLYVSLVKAGEQIASIEPSLGRGQTDASGLFRITVDLSQQGSADGAGGLLFRVRDGGWNLMGDSLQVPLSVRAGEAEVLLQLSPSSSGPSAPTPPFPPPMESLSAALPSSPQQAVTVSLERLIQDHADISGDVPSYRLSRKLVRRDAPAESLSGHRVRVLDLDVLGAPALLMTGLTDAGGTVSLRFPSAAIAVTADGLRHLRLELTDGAGEALPGSVELALSSSSSFLETVLIDAPTPPSMPSPAIADLGLSLSPGLQQALAIHQINTLGDIRRAGGLAQLIPAEPQGDDLVLETHASLSVLTEKLDPAKAIAVQHALIQQGHRGAADVGLAARGLVAPVLREHLGDFGAARFHTEALARARFTESLLAGARIEDQFAPPPPAIHEANFGAPGPDFGKEHLPGKCGCSDCQAALSPTAYLADLLDYAVKHVEDGGGKISLKFLEDLFHQPFGGLPTNCGAVEKRLRQVRIAIEVLRSYRAVHPQLPAVEAALFREEVTYRRKTYLHLLQQMGTSYEEIRLAWRATDAERKALAERLGFEMEPGKLPPADRLSLLDNDPEAVAEGLMEILFGLRVTTRPALDPDLADPPEVLRWRRERLRTLWRAVDHPPPSPEVLIDPDLLTEDDIRLQTTGSLALVIFNDRVKQLKTEFDICASINAPAGRQKKIEDTIGLKWAELKDLADKVKGGRPEQLSVVAEKIDKVPIAIDAFRRLMELALKTGPIATPTEWKEAAHILTQVHKLRELPTKWKEREARDGISFGLLDFQYSDKEPAEDKRYPWRYSLERRLRWQDALMRRAEPPVIDPDLLNPGDLVSLGTNPGDNCFAVWDTRRLEVEIEQFKISLVRRPAGPDHPAGFDDTLNLYLRPGMKRDDLIKLAERQEAGEKIEGTLRQLSLEIAEFLHLVQAARYLSKPGTQLSPTEWSAIDSILTQVYKRRAYARWHEEEVRAEVLLDPRFFKMPTPAPTFPPPPPPPLPEWRATEAKRRAWQRLLRERIDQDQAVIDAFTAAVDVVEDVHLPVLRDSLVRASGAIGTDLPAMAQWLTDRLFIDMQMTGCQKTTRVAQAIETIQGLLFALRTTQARDAYPNLELDADHFDEEWKWIGSYATWRAATFVFLYPENVLQPNLRPARLQSPGFKALVDAVQLNPRFNPELACQAAREYGDYLKDLAHLDPQATCVVTTQIYGDTCLNGTRKGRRPMFYVFAQGRVTGRIYMCARDQESGEQGMWQPVPGLGPDKFKRVRIIGAPAVRLEFGERYIVLVAQVIEKEEQKLALLKYDLEQNRGWGTGDALVLNGPDKAFEAVVEVASHEFGTVKQSQDMPDLPVVAAIRSLDGAIFVNFLNSSLTDFALKDWVDVGTHLKGSGALLKQLHGVVRAIEPSEVKISYFELEKDFIDEKTYPEHVQRISQLFRGNWTPHKIEGQGRRFDMTAWVRGIWFVVSYVSGDLFLIPLGYPHMLYRPHPGFLFPTLLSPFAIGKEGRERSFVGMVVMPSDEVFLIAREGAAGKERCYRLRLHNTSTYGDGEVLSMSYGGPPLAKLALPWRETWGFWSPSLALEITSKLHGPGVYESRFTNRSWTMLETGRKRIAPLLPDELELTEKLPQGSQPRRQMVEEIYSHNVDATDTVLSLLDEATFHVPVYLALQLQQQRHYPSALDWFRTVYDWGEPRAARKIAYLLRSEESLPYDYARSAGWLLDPLNPHMVALSRQRTYSRFILLTLIRCFLEFADAEFTRDTAESLPRARLLYTTVLKLLEDSELIPSPDGCADVIGELDIEIQGIGEQLWMPLYHDLRHKLAAITDPHVLRDLVDQVRVFLTDGTQPWNVRFMSAFDVLERAPAAGPVGIGELLKQDGTFRVRAQLALMKSPALSRTADLITGSAGDSFRFGVAQVLEVAPETLEANVDMQIPWLIGSSGASTGRLKIRDNMVRLDLRPGLDESFTPMRDDLWSSFVDRSPLLGVKLFSGNAFEVGFFAPGASFSFCISPNPLLRALRLQALMNLYKLQNCRNIAGLTREVEPYVAPTDTFSGMPTIGPGGGIRIADTIVRQPSPYRFSFLVERAKHLVSLAGQVESAMLVALEKRDLEFYNLMKARQDLRLTRAQVQLQDLLVKEAESGVLLAELQRDMATIQVDHFEELLSEGLMNAMEAVAFSMMTASAAFQLASAAASIVNVAGAFDAMAAATSTAAQLSLTMSGFVRRQKDWQFNKRLALQDLRIGNQRIVVARDHLRVVDQERSIASMQASNAEVVADFLVTKFTSADLYDWMSRVLLGVYDFLLQQATATARMAQTQLAFERPESPAPTIIEGDYWTAPATGGQLGQGDAPERKGLTGSARLLKDVTQLEQNALDTDRRRMQLTRVLSLSQIDPVGFQRFRQAGRLPFVTRLREFDRDFPGHYLRLIKRVRTTIIALVPPIEGIRATLSMTGPSTVVVPNELTLSFQERRIPLPLSPGLSSVALSAPLNASGHFELDTQQTMLLPFEGQGVAAQWLLELPKPSNPFDFSTIADVLVTIEYTALQDDLYRKQVQTDLDRNVDSTRAFSFRNELADAWYELQNPDESASPMHVRWRATQADFSPNQSAHKIKDITIYFALAAEATPLDEKTLQSMDVRLHFTPAGVPMEVVGEATPPDKGLISILGNAAGWATLFLNRSPFGEWQLELPKTEPYRALFRKELIQDIVFMVSYGATTAPWPR